MGVKLISKKESGLVPIMELRAGMLAIIVSSEDIDLHGEKIIVIKISDIDRVQQVGTTGYWIRDDYNTLCRYLEPGEQIEITE